MIGWPSRVVGQFFKDLDKLPGWVPLYLTIFAALEYSTLEPALWLHGQAYELSTELAATVLTFGLYTLADALDEIVYKVSRGRRTYTRPRYVLGYRGERGEAQRVLGTVSGVYGMSLALVRIAEKDRSAWFVHLLNELAKYLRSLGVAGLIAVATYLYYAQFRLALGALAVTGFCFWSYPWLKVCHTRRLYSIVKELGTSSAFAGDLTVTSLAGVRLVFWKGRLVQVPAA